MRSFIAVLTLGAVLIAAPSASLHPSAAVGSGHEHHREAGLTVHLSRDVATSWPVSEGQLAPTQAPASVPSSAPVIGGGSFQLTAAQVAGYARAAGFPESVIPTMVAIAARESGYNAHAVNLSSGATGLWQIYPGGLQYLDPAANAAAAYVKWLASGLAPWGF